MLQILHPEQLGGRKYLWHPYLPHCKHRNLPQGDCLHKPILLATFDQKLRRRLGISKRVQVERCQWYNFLKSFGFQTQFDLPCELRIHDIRHRLQWYPNRRTMNLDHPRLLRRVP